MVETHARERCEQGDVGKRKRQARESGKQGSGREKRQRNENMSTAAHIDNSSGKRGHTQIRNTNDTTDCEFSSS